MQIWRTARLSPGTSRMQAKLASQALMFCFDRKVLLRRRSGLFLFRPPYKLLCSWMPPEGIAWNLPQQRKCIFFFSFPRSPLRENRRRKVVHDRRGNCWSLFFSLDTTMGAVEVHSLGDYIVVFVSSDSVRVDAKSTSSFETEDVFQEELFFTLEKVLAM